MLLKMGFGIGGSFVEKCFLGVCCLKFFGQKEILEKNMKEGFFNRKSPLIIFMVGG
ncbi:MAG: hypothetical protein ACJATU_000850 [Rickettsiales bacterium]|jgi:hypothetical protein